MPFPEPHVEIWKILPEEVHEPSERLLATLDPAERGRAHGMGTERLRRTYALAHAGLREILASEIGVSPAQVAFARRDGRHGKPMLADGMPGAHAEQRLTFSLSHTRGLILIALARGREVGIDVEWADRHLAEATFSRLGLTEDELLELRLAPAGERSRCLLRAWTRREAHAKMTGEGIARLIAREPKPAEPAGSWLCDLDVGPNHVAAVAVQADAYAASSSG